MIVAILMSCSRFAALPIIGKQTAQSSSHDRYPGELAVDGDINTFSLTSKVAFLARFLKLRINLHLKKS